MYLFWSQGVKAAAEEIDFSAMDRSKLSNFKRSFHTRGIWRDCVFMYTRVRERYVSIKEPRG